MRNNKYFGSIISLKKKSYVVVDILNENISKLNKEELFVNYPFEYLKDIKDKIFGFKYILAEFEYYDTNDKIILSNNKKFELLFHDEL